MLASPTEQRPAPEAQKDASWRTGLLITLPFLVLFWVNLAHHELWLDELNAWGLSVASPNLHSLFANVHYEGHPWLWYFLLWIPARFTHNPIGMKLVDGIVGSATIAVIGILSPFRRSERVLVLLNYFVIFEYTVISRTYGPMLLLAVVYVWRRAAAPDRVSTNLLLLGTLANTDLTGIMLSGALLLEYAIDRWSFRAALPRRQLLTGVAGYVGLTLFSISTLTPSRDISWQTTGHLFAQAGNLRHLVRCVGDVVIGPWVPFPPGFPGQFWNSDIGFAPVAISAVPLVLLVYYWIFRRRPYLLTLLGTTIVFALAFAHLVYLGYVRHWGIVAVACLLALWLLRAQLPATRLLPWAAYVLLAIGAVKGVAAVADSWTHPFSESGIAAHWLESHGYSSLPMAGASDYNLAGVAEELQRPVYFLNCNCVDIYMKFARRRDGMQPSEIPDRIARAMRTLHAARMILVLDFVVPRQMSEELAQRGIRVQPLVDLVGSEDHLALHLYMADSTSAVTGAQLTKVALSPESRGSL